MHVQLEKNQRDREAYIELAEHHQQLGEYQRANEVFETALALCAPSASLYRNAISSFGESNQTKKAIRIAGQATKLFPDDELYFRLKEKLLLPILYDTAEEVNHYHDRFAAGIQELLNDLKLNTPELRRGALNAIGDHSRAGLAYQGRDVGELHEQYARFVHRIMAANYPQWPRRLRMPPASENRKIRIGYISQHFHRHSDVKCLLSWLRELSRDKFETFAFHVGERIDSVTDDIRREAEYFYHLPTLEKACETILRANLHIAVFFDHSPPLMIQLATLRLAPIQCVAWTRAITSGSATIDYFLSSVLTEPESGQSHYYEQLIRLPGAGSRFYKPVIARPLLGLKRDDFGLQSDGTVYLCCQSAFKYLPQYDRVFAAIAKRLPASQFAFLAPNDLIRDDLCKRLDRAFAADGLKGSDHCVLIPRALNLFDYWNLNLVSDVFLDTFVYSGCVTTLEAVACGLPVVTLPGEFHRGRHSYAILRQLGVTETIADSVEEYVDIAVRLGQDREWRAQILQRMSAGHGSLFGDTSSVRALEDFFQRVVREAGAKV